MEYELLFFKIPVLIHDTQEFLFVELFNFALIFSCIFSVSSIVKAMVSGDFKFSLQFLLL